MHTSTSQLNSGAFQNAIIYRAGESGGGGILPGHAGKLTPPEKKTDDKEKKEAPESDKKDKKDA